MKKFVFLMSLIGMLQVSFAAQGADYEEHQKAATQELYVDIVAIANKALNAYEKAEEAFTESKFVESIETTTNRLSNGTPFEVISNQVDKAVKKYQDGQFSLSRLDELLYKLAEENIGNDGSIASPYDHGVER